MKGGSLQKHLKKEEKLNQRVCYSEKSLQIVGSYELKVFRF